jgi:hypothetical protein
MQGATTVVSAVHGLAGAGRASPESVDRDGNSTVVDTTANVEADVVLADVPMTDIQTALRRAAK